MIGLLKDKQKSELIGSGNTIGLLKVTRYKTFKPLKSPLQPEVDPI